MNKKIKAKLFIFTGPSGVGKGTILNDFFKKINDNNSTKITYSISYTTRLPRDGEIDGVHYFFVDEKKFNNLIKNDAFLEYAQYSGNYYGTNKNFVQNKINDNISVLLEIELQGALKVMKKCPDAVSIFITPPSFEELEKRLRNRHTETEEAILKRLECAKIELSNIDKFKYVIENDSVDCAVSKLTEIFNREVADV